MKKKLMSTLLAIALLLTILPVGVSAEADTTRPQVKITQGYPKRTSATTATVKFTTNEAGDYYYGYAAQNSMEAIYCSDASAKSCESGEVTFEIQGIETRGAQVMSLRVRDAAKNVERIDNIIIPADPSVTDQIAPILTVGQVTRISDSKATVKFTSDEAGTCRFAYADTAGEVFLGGGLTFLCDTTEQTIPLEGLTPGAKFMEIQVRDASDNFSNVLYVTIPAYTTPTTTVASVEIFSVVEPVNGEGPNFAWGKPHEATTYTKGDSLRHPTWHVSDTKVPEYQLAGLISGQDAYTYNQEGILAPGSGNPPKLIFETGKWYTFIIELKAVDAVFTAETTATMNGNAAHLLCANPTTGYVAYSFQCTASGGGQGGTPVLPGAANGAFPSNILMALLQNRSFKMTATAGEGGSISAEGTSKVKFARDITYTITPDEGCEIVSVTVDGKDMGPIGEYTFKKVRKAHRIEAVFAPKPVEETPETPETEVTEAN